MLVTTHEPVLKLAVELVEHAVDTRVVEVRGSHAEQLGQRRARKPALRVQLGARCHAALDRKRADDLGGTSRQRLARDESVQKLG